MDRLRAALIGILSVVVLGGAAEPEPGAEPQLVRMGTGSVEGAYFPVGVALCRLANQHRRETGLRCAAKLSGGSVDNVAGLRDGSLGLAIVQSDIQAGALQGTGGFADVGPFEGLRAVMALHPELLTIVARADAGIRGVEDLAGKRVVLGSAGSGTRVIGDALIGALGWTPESFAPTPDLPPDQLANALCDGEIDAFLYAVGHPAPVIQEATTECDAVLVAASGPLVDELVAENPSFVAATVPAGLYRGNPGAVATFGVGATLVSRADVPEDSVYQVVRAVFEDVEMLRGLDPVLAGLEPEAMVSEGLTAPLHPGAERYYREAGLIR
jgi:uncharacterized protein